MASMKRKPAKWRSYLTDEERKELNLSTKAREAVADQLRALTERLKDRCIKRMIRAKAKNED